MLHSEFAEPKHKYSGSDSYNFRQELGKKQD